MKRLFLIGALLFSSSLVVLESCSPRATTTSGTSVGRGKFTGNWTVSNISFENIPDVAVRSFLGEESYKCFIGSSWRLTNSGNGSYELASGSTCGAKNQTIFWSTDAAANAFQFKKLYEGDKARKVTEGYKLELVSSDGNTMVLKTPITYGNTTAYVVMDFTKATK